MASLLASQKAHATLGGDALSIEADRAALHANLSSTQTLTLYSIIELDVGGTRVREFLSRQGKVFGIAWMGITHPDLSLLLGKYYHEHQQAKKGNRILGRRHAHIQSRHLVVKQWGKIRALEGQAYLPLDLPNQVTPDEIK